MSYNPTRPFTILEAQNQWIDEFYVVQERRPKIVRGLVG